MRLSYLLAPAALWLAGCGLVLEGDPPHDERPDASTEMDSTVGSDAVLPDTSPAPFCGDGNLDAPDERCDDGNLVPGDGCEPDCTLSCTTGEDCRDGNPCNGAESCDADTNTCVTGPPQPEGSMCRVGATDGFCTAGFCVPETCNDGVVDMGEQCDDANDVAGDGCDPDCTFSCESDADCTPTTCFVPRCDGATHTCEDVLRDTDGDGYGVGVAGCPGTDCNDGASDVNPGVAFDACNDRDDDCDTMIDEDEPPLICAEDLDGDGFSPIVWTRVPLCISGSVCPPPYASPAGGDCYDSASDPTAADVYPGQTAYFATPSGSPVLPFDYNCDNIEEYRDFGAECVPSMSTDCAMGSGFIDDPLPSCGRDGTFILCGGSAGACGIMMSTQTQHCH